MPRRVALLAFSMRICQTPVRNNPSNRIIRTTPQETAERHTTAASANKPKRNKTLKLPICEWDCSNASARRDQSDNRDWYSILGSTLISLEIRKRVGLRIRKLPQGRDDKSKNQTNTRPI